MALGFPFKVVLTAKLAEELQFTAADAFSANAADFTDKFEVCWAPIFVTNEDANGKFGTLLVLPLKIMVGSDRNCGSEAQDILFANTKIFSSFRSKRTEGPNIRPFFDKFQHFLNSSWPLNMDSGRAFNQ